MLLAFCRLAGPTPIVRALLCKPSVSGGVIVIGGCELDVPQSSQASLIPSENSVTKIIEKRVRDYFNNDGDIELEGFILHYSVSLDGPCPLIYACVASPLFGSKNAQTFLNTVKDAVLGDLLLLPLIPHAKDYELQERIAPYFMKLLQEAVDLEKKKVIWDSLHEGSERLPEVEWLQKASCSCAYLCSSKKESMEILELFKHGCH